MTLDPTSLTVTRNNEDPLIREAAIETKDDEEHHRVASNDVCPNRPLIVSATSPMLAPCTVTDPDPVPARF